MTLGNLIPVILIEWREQKEATSCLKTATFNGIDGRKLASRRFGGVDCLLQNRHLAKERVSATARRLGYDSAETTCAISPKTCKGHRAIKNASEPRGLADLHQFRSMCREIHLVNLDPCVLPATEHMLQIVICFIQAEHHALFNPYNSRDALRL